MTLPPPFPSDQDAALPDPTQSLASSPPSGPSDDSEAQAGSGFIGSPALGLQSSLPALEPHGVRWCRSGEQRGPSVGGSSEGGKKGLMSPVAQACTEHIPADGTAHGGLWPRLLTSGPSWLPPPAARTALCVPLTRAPGLREGQGPARVGWEGWSTLARTLSPVLRWCHSCLSTPSPVPGGLPSPTVCRSSARNVHFCPAGQLLGDHRWGAPSWAVG